MNSIHYILDGSGRPIDAIPGLYSPKAFLRQLQQAEVAVKNYSKLTPSDRESYLRKYHSDRLNSIQAQWIADLSRLGIQSPPKLMELPSNPSQPPTAEIASPLAVSKMIVERPMLNALQSDAERNQNALTEITDREVWNKIAQLYTDDAKLDQNSISLIRAKKSQSANIQEDNLLIIVRKFEATMALDTVRSRHHISYQKIFSQGETPRAMGIRHTSRICF